MQVAPINRDHYQKPLVPQDEQRVQREQQEQKQVERRKVETNRVDKFV